MLKISWEIDTVRWMQELQAAGLSDVKSIDRIISYIKTETKLAFDSGRDFQLRYKNEDEDEI